MKIRKLNILSAKQMKKINKILLAKAETMSQKNQVKNLDENFSSVQNINEAEVRSLKNKSVCPQLDSLNICLCNLSKIPEIVFSLKHLTQLNLSNNYLESLPNEIGNLHNLLTLNLSGNHLTSLPDSVKYMHNLNSLDVSCNDLLSVPNVLYGSLRMLKVLDLSFNRISDFNCAPLCVNSLTVLKLSCNRLIGLPKWVLNSLCQLVVLDIGGNCVFSDIKINVFFTASVFESLQFLNVENCKLSYEKIQFLSHFKNLEVLCAGNKKKNGLKHFQNYLTNLNVDLLKNFKILKCLYLQSVHISTLSLGFDCMKSLEILDLSENLLSWLPECICDLVSLRILNLTSNQLIFLPSKIDYLINLEELHFANNNLHSLPEGIYNLKNLKYADFYNNKIKEINSVIFKKKNLKGIDLGLNCLQHNFCQFDNDVIKIQYEHLKNSLRKHFKYENTRCDTQIPNISSEDECCSSNSYSNCSDASDSDDFVATQNNCQDDFKEENWEEEVLQVDKDDLFNPNEMQSVSSRLAHVKDVWSSEFRDNYCPAYNHKPTFMATYASNVVKSISKYKSVEGQFDSD